MGVHGPPASQGGWTAAAGRLIVSIDDLAVTTNSATESGETYRLR